MRSSSAAALLKGQGFNEVYSIKGGIEAWHGLRATGEYDAGMYLIEGKKTLEEFLSLAWSLEDGTRIFYETVKEVIADKESGMLFDALVKAEEMHKATVLEAYRHIRKDEEGSRKFPEQPLAGVMESGVSVDEAVAWVKGRDRDPRDILEFSMQLETNSLDFYLKALRETEDKEIQKTFHSLIDEEKRHLARLGNLLNSMYNV